MKKILIGTHNQGKFREIAYLLSKRYKKISPLTLKIRSPRETGKTFAANSKLKVKFFSKFVKYPVISDDSGLCIRALGNKPGIHSARLAQRKGSFYLAMKFILKKLKEKKNKSATFVCNLSYRKTNGKIVSVEGKIYGKISNKILGKNGFGYDSIFIPNKQKITFGQMSKLNKIKMDHRFIAFKKLKKKIKIL
jgi:XTP/dITP diphosphohydrolase